MTASITANKDHSTQEYYVLRNTAYTVTAIPVEGDEVYQVKAINAAAQTQTYDVTSAGDDSSGHPTFTVDSLSHMGEEMIIRVYFTDIRAFGAIKVENYDVEGEPIALPASATMIMKVTHPIYLEEPAYDVLNGNAPVRNNVRITGATAHYKVTVGGEVRISLNWGEDYCLYSYKLRYKDGHEEGPFYSGKNMYYELKPTVSDDSEVTVVNYFIKTSSVNQEAYYADTDGNLTPKKRFPKSTDKFYSLYFDGALLINGNSLFSKNLSTKSGMDHGFFASGPNSGYSLRITELAGYTLSKLKLSCSGVGSWELTREQLTEESVSDTGNNVIEFNVNTLKQGSLQDEEFANLKNAFGYLKDNGTYTVQAYFTARLIHVTAYEVSQEQYEQMREVGIKNYMDEHSLGLFPAENSVKMNVGDTTYSVDGAQTGQYFSQSGYRVTIGVRDQTQPTCVIYPVVKITNSSTSITRDYYRIGAVLYGQTESTMVSKYLGSVLPMPMGQTYLLNCDTMNTDQYVSIVYVKYTEQETKPEKPPVLVNDGTVVDQSSLTFYVYEYDEATSEKKLVTDPAELARYDVRFDVSQKCVGYYSDPHDPTSNQSNATHHANYTPENGEQNVYEHDTRDTVIELINGTNTALVGPMAVDSGSEGFSTDYSTENADPPATVHVTHVDDVYGRANYGVKTNSIDTLKVKMNATVPENYRLEKMEVQRGGSSKQINKPDYEYTTAAGEDVTVIYVFSRPNLSISTNNEPDENGNPTKAKGSVSVVTPEGEIIGLKETDKKQSIRFDAGKELKLSVQPMVKQSGSDYAGTDYELDYVRVTDSTGKKVMYRTSDFAADGTLSIGNFSKDIDVLVQFREVEGDEKATVFVSKYYTDGEGNVYPLTEKCGVTVFGQNETSDKPLQLGSVKDSTFALTTESEMTLEASPGTALKFTLGEESGFRLSDDPFHAEYSNNGSAPVAISASNNSSVWNISSDYAVNNAVISVDVYYIPTYRVRYHGNGQDSGIEPTDMREYATGDVLGTAEHPLADRGSLAHRGFSFDGWSTESGDSNSDAKVTEITFQGMDIDLYAVWMPKDPLHVTYDGNGNTSGTPPTDGEAYYNGETVTVLGRNGMEKTAGGVTYEFAGWNTDSSAITALYKEYDATQQNVDGKFTITTDTTLYAVWLPQYRVTYHDALDTPPTDGHVYHSGDEVTVLGTAGTEKTFDGVTYRFDGWSLTENGTAVYVPAHAERGKFNITANTDLYAVWTVNTPQVRYTLTVPDDVTFTVPAAENYEYGTQVSVEAKPNVSDYDPLKYTFHGWNTVSTDLHMNEAGTSFTMPDHDVEFTGYFTENGKVNLSYNANGGTPADKVPASVSRHTKIETTVANLPAECVKEGHTFDHWNTAADGSGISYKKDDPITVEGSDVVLYAQWNRNSYIVEYYGLKNGETGEKLLKQENYPFGQATEIGGVTLDEIPGKVFNKWALADTSQKDANGQAIGERLSFPMPDDTVVYRAVYDDLIYSVEYRYNGTIPTGVPGLPVDALHYSFGSTVSVAPVPTLAGYTFDGWKLGEIITSGFTINEEIPVTVSGTLSRKVILTGEWVRNGDVCITYTSGFTADNAPDDSLKFVGKDTCTKGLDYTLRKNSGFTNYNYPGYTFSGWKVVSETASPNSYGWFAKLFNVFTKRLLSVGDVYDEGATIPALKQNITLQAVWTQNPPEPEKYRVTYDGNGATGGQAPTDSNEYAAGSTPEVLRSNTLVKTDSEFKGWNTKPDGSGTHYTAGDKLPAITSDVTLYAEWEATVHEPDTEPEKYRVTYDGNGATGGNVPEDHASYTGGDKVTVLSQGDLAKEGYTFDGWNTKADGTGTTYQLSEEFMISQNITLYAVWTKKNDPGQPGIPGTGESGWMIVLAAMALLLSSGTAITILYRRRMKESAR